ncbi:MAG TPA: hypothetical protein PLR06_13970, partial [Cyclobacteriaceae bacterium]|nr:hypothetical protein [Cyclobacteriaceae bacterium]
MKRIIWSGALSLLVLACLDSPNCGQSSNTLVGISFKTMFDGRSDTVALVKITASGTTNVYDSAKAVSFVSLPLNYIISSSIFKIQTVSRNYTLDLGFKTQPKFLTEDCPERIVLSDLSIRNQQGADSVKLISSEPSNPATNNITIYRCPHNYLLKLSFRQLYMDTVKRGKLDTRAITSVTADFLGTIYGAVSTNTLFLPLNLSSDRTQYTINFADGTTRNVYVSYQIALKTLFKTCSTQKFPYKLGILSQNFELIQIRRDSIYDPPKTNLETFRCPIPNQITAIFKNVAGTLVSDTLKSITADYLGTDTLYRNKIGTSVVLP